MAFSYSGDPATSQTDEVRYMVGDTDSDFPLLQDEEILFVLKKFNFSIYQTALFCCHRILMKVSSLVDGREGQVSSNSSQLQAHYKKRIEDLKKEFENINPPEASYGGGNSEHYFEVKNSNENLKKQFNDFDSDNPRARHGF